RRPSICASCRQLCQGVTFPGGAMSRLPVRAAALLLAVAAAAPAAEKLEQPKVTIAVGGKTLFYYLPLTLAERLGYFKDEGLDVQIADFPGGAKALQAMVGGSA